MESGESKGEALRGMFRFQKLDIWKRSVRFANAIYDITETFPRKEQFGLTSQLTRSAKLHQREYRRREFEGFQQGLLSVHRDCVRFSV